MKKSMLLGAGLYALSALASPPLEKAEVRPATMREIAPTAMRQAAPQRAAALSLPASFPIATQDEFNTYATVDGNNDGKTWKYENKSACYEGIGTTYADDWLILPMMALTDPSGSYTVSLEVWKLYQAESMEVCISPTTNVTDAISVFSTSDIANSATLVSADFNVADPGDYYLMIHANSPKNGLSLYVRNIQVMVNRPQAFTVPFEMVPVAEEAKHFSVVNSNADDKTWYFDTSNIGFSIESHRTNVSDDYLLLPAISISEPGNYKFAWDARVWGEPQSLDVLVGQGDDPTTFRTIFREAEASGTQYTREVVFSITEPGDYRLALHCTTAPNHYKLLTKNYKLTATSESPAAPLPMSMSGPVSVSAANIFTVPFSYAPNSRVKLDFDVKGGAVSVGFAQAPATEAVRSLFATEASGQQQSVSKVFVLPGEGIGYISFSAPDGAEVSNISLMLYSEEDEAYQLPFCMQPTAEEFLEFKVVNVNGDAATWSYYDGFGAARAAYSTTEKADDWLILPAINVPATDRMLSFSLKARGMAVTLPETFEVWAGKSADVSEMVKLYDSPEIRTEQFEPLSFSFTPQWAGITFFAVRATSEPKMFYLFVRDFEVKADGRTSTVPRPVTDLTATAEDGGSLSAKVSFTMPSLTEGGEQMTAGTQLTAEIVTRAGTFTTQGTPGSRIETVVESGQGEGVITVSVSNAAGKSNSRSVSVYTGQDRPAPASISSLKADATNRTVHITWTLPEKGANGGYVDPEKVTYLLRHSTGSGSYTNLATVERKCEYTYTIPDTYSLEMHYFIVIPSNVAGEAEQGNGSGIMLGKPHEIPAVEDFTDGNIALGPIGMATPDARYTLDWYFDNPALGFDEAANLSGHALIAFTEQYGPARGRLCLPKFDTRGDYGARLVLRLYNYPHFAPTEVYAEVAEGEPVLIGRIEPAEQAGWHEYSLPLPQSLLGLQWVAPYLDFGFNGSYDDEIWMLDRYGMEHYFDREIDVRPLVTHTLMKAFEISVWTVEVGNYGRETVTFDTPELCFTDTDGNVDSFAAADAGTSITLTSGENIILTYNVNLGTEMEGEIVYDITLPVDGDGNPDNNYFAGTTEVWQQSEYVVRDLAATRDEEGVQLSWSAPSTGYGILYVDNLRSWEYGSQIGLFTNYDGDRQPVTGFVGASFPGMGMPKGWQVFDYEEGGFNFIYAGYLGSAKSLIAFSPVSGYGAADDWLISPEVKGGTELTFYVRPLHFGYGREKIEILTSSTTPDPESFTLLSTYLTAEGEKDKTPYWEEVETILPDDARYFAIRYVSNDIFGLQLDDIIYTPAQEDENELTYTVLCNGEPIATGVSDTRFHHATAEAGTYHVAAEKAYGGLHPLSNRVYVATLGVGSVEADISVSAERGELLVRGAEGKSLTVAAADGRIVYTTSSAPADLRLPQPAGLYIVTSGTSAPVKVLVP